MFNIRPVWRKPKVEQAAPHEIDTRYFVSGFGVAPATSEKPHSLWR